MWFPRIICGSATDKDHLAYKGPTVVVLEFGVLEFNNEKVLMLYDKDVTSAKDVENYKICYLNTNQWNIIKSTEFQQCLTRGKYFLLHQKEFIETFFNMERRVLDSDTVYYGLKDPKLIFERIKINNNLELLISENKIKQGTLFYEFQMYSEDEFDYNYDLDTIILHSDVFETVFNKLEHVVTCWFENQPFPDEKIMLPTLGLC